MTSGEDIILIIRKNSRETPNLGPAKFEPKNSQTSKVLEFQDKLENIVWRENTGPVKFQISGPLINGFKKVRGRKFHFTSKPVWFAKRLGENLNLKHGQRIAQRQEGRKVFKVGEWL